MKRKYARVDSNHAEIVSALRQAGCSVQSLAAVGCGCPDLLVAVNGRLCLLEVKDGKKIPSKQRLTDDEEFWHFRWRSKISIVTSAAEALLAMFPEK